MKIATWNVNSVRARLDAVLNWLAQAQPDVACFQEIKATNDSFPTESFENLGYNCAVYGQKSYNGVAILSKRPLEDVTRNLPDCGPNSDPDSDNPEQARYIEAIVAGDCGLVRVASIYAPNGNPVGGERFAYKLSWLERLRRSAIDRLANEEAVILTGDYNIIAQPVDCYDPNAWKGDALYQPESRAAFRQLEYAGYTDAFRACHGQETAYTFWDYQAGAWPKNNGIRIDHILLSPQATDRLETCGIDRHVRAWEKPSDHVPVWCELAI